MAYKYFDKAHAIIVHDEIIDISGGFKGMFDEGLLDSTLEHVKNDTYYPELVDKLTYLFYAINKNHCFTDGNKRSSIALSAYFLEVNCFDFRVTRFIQEMENIAVDVADNRIDRALLFEIIDSILFEDDYSEELKLKIINAKTGNDLNF